MEEEYGIEILYAKDFGSNAWNLDSEESDRDIGFIFKQDKLDYIRIGGYEQNIDRTVEHGGKEHTVQGWNIKRFAELLNDSNPTVLEFLNSRIVYRDARKADWGSIIGYANSNFKPVALMGHYHSLAKNQYRRYIQERIFHGGGGIEQSFPIIEKGEGYYKVDTSDSDRGLWKNRDTYTFRKGSFDYPWRCLREESTEQTVKRNLYAVRALLYKEYIAHEHEFPTLNFPKFLKNQIDPGAHCPERVRQKAVELAEMKRNGEGSEEVGNPLKDWIEDRLEDMGSRDLDSHYVNGIEQSRVNEFLKTIFEYTEAKGDEVE